MIFLIGLAITLSIAVISFIRYEKYMNRADFKLETVNGTVPNQTYFYILRRSANISQCSSKARFDVNVTELYELMVRKSGLGIFHGIFWLNFLVSLAVNILDVIDLIKTICSCGESNPKKRFYYDILDKTFLRLMRVVQIWISSLLHFCL